MSVYVQVLVVWNNIKKPPPPCKKKLNAKQQNFGPHSKFIDGMIAIFSMHYVLVSIPYLQLRNGLGSSRKYKSFLAKKTDSATGTCTCEGRKGGWESEGGGGGGGGVSERRVKERGNER